jgi:hypothetical protein
MVDATVPMQISLFYRNSTNALYVSCTVCEMRGRSNESSHYNIRSLHFWPRIRNKVIGFNFKEPAVSAGLTQDSPLIQFISVHIKATSYPNINLPVQFTAYQEGFTTPIC